MSESVPAGLRRLEVDQIKLEVLREKLQAGEDSPVVVNFDAQAFIGELHAKYYKKDSLPAASAGKGGSGTDTAV